jgi:hypothetical protein
MVLGTGDRPRPALTPSAVEDTYRRNAGRPGFIYAARNGEHVPGLYKIGQTHHQAAVRLAELNRDHAALGGAGTFGLLAYEATPDAFNTEQLLHDMLRSRRASPTREFFWASADEIRAFMRQATEQARRGAWTLPPDLNLAAPDPAWQMKQAPLSPDQAPESGDVGWLAVLANSAYRSGLYRLMGGSTPPGRRARLLNEEASVRPVGIGNWQVAHEERVAHPQIAFETLKRAMAPKAFPSGTNFFEAPLEDLVLVLGEVASRFPPPSAKAGPRVAVAAPAPPEPRLPSRRPSPAPPSWTAEIERGQGVVGPDETFTVTVVDGYVRQDQRPWTTECGACGLELMLHARIGDVGLVRCPKCGHEDRYRQRAYGSERLI